MLRKFRGLSNLNKVVVLLFLVAAVGLASGSQQGAAVTALAVLLLLAIFLWWIVSRVASLIRRSKRRTKAVKSLNTLQARGDSSPVANVLAPNWAPPLQRTIHSPGIGDVLALTPGQFEDMTAILLTSLGYTAVQRTGKAGDLGTDITCRDPQDRTAIVQCKRYAPGNTIGTPVVQTFIGMMTVHHRIERGLIVTTVPFTQQAVDLARHHGIALIDGQALLLLLHLTGIPLYKTVNSYLG